MTENNNQAEYLFHQGTNFYSYDYLGCTLNRTAEAYEYTFRTWAPNADEVLLASDYTGWDTNLVPLTKTSQGVWECQLTSLSSLEGTAYKLVIKKDGNTYLKGDPYARYSRGGADGASIIFCESKHKWQDDPWLKERKKRLHNL